MAGGELWDDIQYMTAVGHATVARPTVHPTVPSAPVTDQQSTLAPHCQARLQRLQKKKMFQHGLRVQP